MLSVFSSLVEDVYPALNAQISKCLIKKGIKQSTIASYLGITQAMVSKYAAKSHKINKELEKAITEFSEKVAQEIIDKVSKENIATLVTKQSLQWIESGLLCDHTKKKFKLEDCSSCYNLLLPQTKKEKQDIIRNLEQAVMLLEKQDLHELIPEVRMNIAMATTSATVKEDVASIPGRLIAIDNRLKALMKPRFGTSHFLSALLLQIKEHSPETNAIINIKYNNQIKKLLDKYKFKYLEDLNLLASSNVKDIDCIIQKGAVGIEANVYMLGKNAIDVVNKVLKLK